MPLSKQALQILIQLQLITGQYNILFPSERDRTKPMSDNAVRRAMMRMAEPMELEAFSLELGAFDEATIKAILENREILERLYLERDAMFDAAYQLDDGTRVFKSQDGVTVINEFGENIPPRHH